MALQTEVWAADIATNLFKNNEFVRRSKNDDVWVENAIVHLPQAGQKPTVIRGRVTVPATIAPRTDAEATYALAEFTSDPTLIKDIEATEVSYDKRSSVLEEHTLTLQESIGSYTPFVWCPTGAAIATNFVPTSGAARPAMATGATGTRKKISKTDILAAKNLLDRMDVPLTGRVILFPSDMYNDLLTDPDLLTSFNMNQGNLPDGVVGRIFGFEIMMRSSVGSCVVTTNVIKDPAAATAATDNAVAIVWHPQFTRFALGEIKVFADENKPEYYGSIFSALVRAGGRAARQDFKGVVAIVEAP